MEGGGLEPGEGERGLSHLGPANDQKPNSSIPNTISEMALFAPRVFDAGGRRAENATWVGCGVHPRETVWMAWKVRVDIAAGDLGILFRFQVRISIFSARLEVRVR